jgi:hypothetical protein
MIPVGTSLYGRVDQVRGLFYAATSFFHIAYFPLLPLRTYLIMDGTQEGDAFRGSPIQLSWKSIFFAYLRLGLIGLAGFALVTFILVSQTQPAYYVVSIVVPACIGWFYWYSYRLSRAGEVRALNLALQVGIDPNYLARFFASPSVGLSVDPAESESP